MENNKKNNKEKRAYKDTVKEVIPYVIIKICVVLVRTFLITPIKVNGTSMTDTLHHRDTMILNKISMKFNDIERFQIVVIDSSDSYIIKRIIALPGESIEYKNNRLYINDKIIADPYNGKNETEDFEKVTVPKGHYFVMGDNRGNSWDSRSIGFIGKEDILGTIKLVIFPFKNIGIVK